LGGDNTYVKFCGLDNQRCTKLGGRCLEQSEKDIILKKHNELRAMVAKGGLKAYDGVLPSAANMNELVWDDELALGAQM
jgi:hypothetical protein